MYNQQQPPYPPADRLLLPPIQIGLNNPPYVPNNYVGPNWMMQLVPVVAAGAAVEIQNKTSSQSPLRIFMCNQMAVNYFANQEFDNLVKIILDYIVLGVQNRVYANPEVAVQDAVSRVCELYCANNLAIYPHLGQMLNQQTAAVASMAINEYRNMIAQVESMRVQMRSSQYPQQPQYPQQQFQQPQYPQQQFQQPQYPQQQFQQPQYPQQPQFQSNAPSVFSQQPNRPSNVSKSVSGGGKYSRDILQQKQTPDLSQPFTPRATEMTQSAPVVAQAVSSIVPVNLSGIKWRPLKHEHYYPVTNILTHELYYNIGSDGNVSGVFTKPRESKLMDEERHKLITVFGTVPEPFKFENSDTVFVKLTESHNKVQIASSTIQAEPEKIIDPEITTYINGKTLVKSSLADAWTNLNVHRLQSFEFTGGEVSKIYRGYYIVANTIISTHDDIAVLNEFSATKTFEALSRKMLELFNNSSLEFWTQCNVRMTALINRLLKEEMGIPGVSIENFVTDIVDLINHIGTEFGDVIFNSFLKHQDKYIKTVMLNLHDNHSYYDPECTLPDSDDPASPHCTYLATEYCLTYIDYSVFDLGINLADNLSAKLEYGTCSFLYGLVNSINAANIARESEFSRNLIRTKDGRVISFCKGLIDDSSYLLTLVE